MELLHKKILAVGSAIAILTAGFFYYQSSQTETIDLQNEIVYEDQSELESEGMIVVYITGAVKNPGVIDIPENSRVLDAVNAAGGVTSSADLESINMAQRVKDGQHVTVPELSFDENENRIVTKKSNSMQKNSLVNINTADESELISLPGIGPATAKKIIDYRENNGSFVEIEDIKKVRGIGNSKFESMKDFITT